MSEFELVITPADNAFATIDIVGNPELAENLYEYIGRDCERIETENNIVMYYDPGSEYDVLFAVDVPTDFSQLVDQSQHKGVYIFNIDKERPVVFGLPNIGYSKNISEFIAEDMQAFTDDLTLAVLYDNNSISISELDNILKTLTEHTYQVIMDRGYTIILVAIRPDIIV